MTLTAYCEGAKYFSMTLSVNVKSQLIEKRVNTCTHISKSELVKLILYGHTKFQDQSVPLMRSIFIHYCSSLPLLEQAFPCYCVDFLVFDRWGYT